MKIPEKIVFKVTDLLPLFGVWNDQNRGLIHGALFLGLICGALVGFVTGLTSWGQPFYYAWYFGISTEAYALMLAIKIVEKRHHQEVNVWLLSWLKILYWTFFFLLAEGAILLLELINSGTPWLTVLESTKIPNGIAYANTLNAILIGIIAAFPSKIVLQILSGLLRIRLLFPFSEFAEITLSKLDEPLLTVSSYRTYAVPREIVHLANQAHHFAKVGDHISELRVADEAVQLCTDSAVAHNNRGCALANLGRYDEAIEEFEKAIDLVPRNIAAGLAVPVPYPDPAKNLELALSLRRKQPNKDIHKQHSKNWGESIKELNVWEHQAGWGFIGITSGIIFSPVCVLTLHFAQDPSIYSSWSGAWRALWLELTVAIFLGWLIGVTSAWIVYNATNQKSPVTFRRGASGIARLAFIIIFMVASLYYFLTGSDKSAYPAVFWLTGVLGFFVSSRIGATIAFLLLKGAEDEPRDLESDPRKW